MDFYNNIQITFFRVISRTEATALDVIYVNKEHGESGTVQFIEVLMAPIVFSLMVVHIKPKLGLIRLFNKAICDNTHDFSLFLTI